MIERRRLIRKGGGNIERRRLIRKREPGDRETSNEEVGYGKPPRHTRWAPGTSGNRKGRPRGSKNFITELNDELRAPVTVIENGQRKTISKKKAIAKQLVNKAVGGDPRTLPIVLNEMRVSEQAPKVAPAQPAADDQSVMRAIVRRIRNAAVESHGERGDGGAPEQLEGDRS